MKDKAVGDMAWAATTSPCHAARNRRPKDFPCEARCPTRPGPCPGPPSLADEHQLVCHRFFQGLGRVVGSTLRVCRTDGSSERPGSLLL